ncbi:PhzF family phenazine biosynthesis protein [Sphingomonas sp. ERG5]|uniref:PhzF family phenazine biosynthesis protein n=1 Tax=Sphingomonas sp. ERG5 TaxID=1381597 RepID=UPI00054B51C0|nr:PhzF family phenazine biosynthesis protein [Sphingomonas sp. ERG5]
MGGLVFGMVDVFADAPLEGNPLAVVEGGEQLSDDVLRAIAREFNQAETTFIMNSAKADRKLRSFTAAGAEVFGAGHNALGAWLWLARGDALGPLDSATTFQQEIGDAVLPVVLERRDGQVHGRMRQKPLRLLPALSDTSGLAAALGLAAGDFLFDPAPRVGDTGAAHLLVRVRDKAAVDRAEPNVPALLSLLEGAQAEGCYVYWFDADSGADAYARFFNPTVGLWEDAATGTAAGPLAAYLFAERLLRGTSLLVEQGTRLGRRSLLSIQVGEQPELSGSGIVVMEGRILL